MDVLFGVYPSFVELKKFADFNIIRAINIAIVKYGNIPVPSYMGFR